MIMMMMETDGAGDDDDDVDDYDDRGYLRNKLVERKHAPDDNFGQTRVSIAH